MTWDYYNLHKADLRDQSSDFKLKKIDNIMGSNFSSEKKLELIKRIVNEEPTPPLFIFGLGLSATTKPDFINKLS